MFQIAYWSFQILSVAIASIVFHIYTTHKMALVSKALQKKRKFEEEKRKVRQKKAAKAMQYIRKKETNDFTKNLTLTTPFP